MRRCCGRFWRKCKPSRFAVSENQPYGRRPVGSPRDGLCPGIGSWGRNVAHECRWEVKCPCASPDFDFRHRIRVGQTALEFIWIRKPLNCVKPTDYRVGVEKCGLGGCPRTRSRAALFHVNTHGSSRWLRKPSILEPPRPNRTIYGVVFDPFPPVGGYFMPSSALIRPFLMPRPLASRTPDTPLPGGPQTRSF